MFQLHEMRNHPVLKYTMYVVFALVIVSFIFFYGWHPNEQRQSQVYARLESGRILGGWQQISSEQLRLAKEQVVNEKRMLLPRDMQQQLQPSVADKLASPPEAAQEAANQVLVDRKARELGVRITRDDIVNFLRGLPNVTDEKIRQRAQSMGMDVEGFLEYLRRTQQTEVVRQLQQMTAQASLYEVWQEYALAKEKIKLQMAAYPAENFKAQVPVVDSDLQGYLDQHKAKFSVPDQRRYAFAMLAKSDLQEKIQVTTAALQTYYEKNQGQFAEKAGFRTEEIVAPLGKDHSTSNALRVLNEIRPEAAKTKDWEALATDLGAKNPQLKFFHRQSPWLTKEDSQNRSPAFMQRAAALSNDQVSTPVLDESSAYLIRVLERRKEGTPALPQIHEKVENAYREAEAQKQMEAAQQHWEEVLPQHKSVASFALAVGAKDELTTRVARSDAYIPGFTSLYNDKAYLEGLKLHELSSLVKTGDLIGVLEVVEELPAHDPPLTEVRPKVEAAYRQERAAILARDDAQQSFNLVKSGANFEQALANAPRKPFITEPFTRRDSVPGLAAPLLEFSTQTLTMKVGSTGISPFGNDPKAPQGYAVWKAVELTPPTKDEFAKDRQQFVNDYLQVQRMAVLREWLADQRQKAKFEIVAKD